MNFYKLEKKEYKKLSKEFRNTYVGGHLYLIYDWYAGLALFGLMLNGFESFYNESIGDKVTILDGISSINIILMASLALISYCLYFNHFKKYVESKQNK